MNSTEFKQLRHKMKKTQKQMAQLLGTSLKAVHSYEQGWRTIPAAVERQMFFLIAAYEGKYKGQKPCWVIKNCPPDRKKMCPAWEFKTGNLCWFISGTICEGGAKKDWKEKMKICRSCEVFRSLVQL